MRGKLEQICLAGFASALAVASLGCDKVKNLVGKLGDAAAELRQGEGKGAEIDPGLAALVDENESGYLFRRDLEFPRKLDVRVTELVKMKNGRVAGRSLMGNTVGKVSIRIDGISLFELADSRLKMTVEKMRTRELVDETKIKPDDEKKEDPGVKGQREGKGLSFSFDGKRWRMEPTSDFSTMAWGKETEVQIPALMSYQGLVPRPRWFGDKRMKAGDSLKLSAKTLDLVFEYATGGEVDLVFEGMEGVRGHPCGRFSITGELERKGVPDGDGKHSDQQITISKGKVWLSLLHPLVMKMETDTIQSVRITFGGNLTGQYLGQVEESVEREWTVRD